MKKSLLFIFLFSILIDAKGQNLVPNGDFELYSGCPSAFSQLILVNSWMNPSLGSPDYYHQCATNQDVDVPNNYLGYQPAQSGNAYVGIFMCATGNLREYVEIPLQTTLVTNTCYHFEMYVNLGNDCKYTTDDIGIYFSDTAITGINNPDPLSFTPQLNNVTGNIFDTLSWTLVAGNYTAIGGENYLTIGNFKNETLTNSILINNSGTWYGGYCYIDNVCLAACGSSCTTGMEEQNQNAEIKIYPNPVGDWLNVQFSNSNFQNKKTEIKITDVLGKEILRKQFSNSKFQIPTSRFQSGIYFIEINNGKNILRKKFLKE